MLFFSTRLFRAPRLRSRWVSSPLLFFFGALQVLPLVAQNQLEMRYYERLRTTDDGLPHNSVRSILQDQRGFIWLATVGGLARFDGREIEEIKVPESFRKTGYNIRAMGQESDGALLIATTSGDFIRLRGTEFSPHPVSAYIKGAAAPEFTIETGGVIWVLAGTRTLFRWENGRIEQFGKEERIGPTTNHLTVAHDGDGNTWLGADDFLGVYRNGQLNPSKDIPTGSILVAGSKTGEVWRCTSEGLARLQQGRWVVVLSDVPWKSAAAQVRCIFEDSQGALWIASSRMGLYRFSNGQLTHLQTSFSAASFIMEDREGNLWVGTDGNGVAQLREKNHQLYNTHSGLPQDACSALAEDPSGAIWVANRAGGPIKIVDFVPQAPTENSTINKTFSNLVCADREGYLWFGGGSGGLWRARLSALDRVEKMPEPSGNFNLLYCARNGDVWFARNNLLGYYREGISHLLPLEPWVQLGRFQSIAEDRSGNVWFGTSEGSLVKYDGKNLMLFDDHGRLPKQSIHSLYIDEADVFWIATADGLGVKEGDRLQMISQAQGLADNLIIQVLEDDHGYLWLGCRRGLFYVSRADLLAVTRGTSERVLCHIFGKEQGLLGFSPTTNYQPSTHKSRDDTLWFATSNGALAIDAKARKTPQPPPPVYIDKVLIDNRPTPEKTGLKISPGEHTFEFRFAVPSFVAPESIEVRHQLVGVDREWIQTSNARTATYSHLHPGLYKLRAIARNSEGVWNKEGASIEFTLLPAWWQTSWASVGAMVLFAAAVASAARYWAQRKLKQKLDRLEREHALEKERTRIARDLHDDLGGGLIELGLIADRLAMTSPPDVRGPLQTLASRTRRLGAELASIIWAVNTKNESLDRLAVFVRSYCRRLFHNSSIECVVTGAESISPFPLSPDTQHHLLAIAKEAVANVLKHSRATHVSVEMRQIGDLFELSVEDNGRGFASDAAEANEGNGLLNMRSRAAEINGSLKIDSGPDRGTIIVLTYRCGLIRDGETEESPSRVAQ